MFYEKDIAIDDGPLTDILFDSIVEMFKEKLRLEFEQDYSVKDLKCTFHEPTNQKANTSKLEFEMRITENLNKPFPKHLSNGKSPETKVVAKTLKQNISEDIFHTYRMEVEIYFNRWGFGSLIIGGSIVLLHGDFNKETKEQILNLIKSQTENFFVSPCVEISETVNELDLQLVLDVISPHENVLQKVEKNKECLTQCFSMFLNRELAKGTLFLFSKY